MNKEQILYEDKDIIVCYKPAGIATQTARIGQRDMVSEVANYLLARDSAKRQTAGGSRAAGAGYIGCVHRLDQPVEGILVFAGNQKAAAELSRQITENRMEKYYYAVVSIAEQDPDSAQKTERKSKMQVVPEGKLTDYLLKENKTNLSRIVSSDEKGAKKAVLEYKILERKELFPEDFPEKESFGKNPVSIALASIRLITGRHHQIRVQMSHAGMSLLGDYKYADERTKRLSGTLKVKQTALCAYRLDFIHPATGEKLSFQKEPEGVIFQNFSRQISDKFI